MKTPQKIKKLMEKAKAISVKLKLERRKLKERRDTIKDALLKQSIQKAALNKEIKNARSQRIKSMRESGSSFKEISSAIGIGHARCRQVYEMLKRRENIIPNTDRSPEVTPYMVKPYESPESDVATLGLSTRALNCCYNANIVTVGQLLNISDAELIKYRHCGKITLHEIKAALGRINPIVATPE